VPVLQTFAGARADAGAGGAATGGDPAAFALGMTGCNKRKCRTAEQSMHGKAALFLLWQTQVVVAVWGQETCADAWLCMAVAAEAEVQHQHNKQ
jgi:hypothetical protein